METVHSAFAHWEGFYVIVGTSAAALEDWVYHFVVAFLGYIGLLVAHMALRHEAYWAPYGIGAVALLLLFLSIRNAWDIVTYMVVSKGKDS